MDTKLTGRTENTATFVEDKENMDANFHSLPMQMLSPNELSIAS